MPVVAPFGSWRSPITSDQIARAGVGLGQVALDRDDVFWIESRPTEGGRIVLVRRTPDGRVRDVNPAETNVRSRVHEYGGGAYAVGGGVVVFEDFASARLWRLDLDGDGAPLPLTPAIPDMALRHADLALDLRRRRVVCVQEDHRDRSEAENLVVEVALDPAGEPAEPRPLVRGHDFFSNPRLSPDGSLACWLAWDHPNMPWDGCGLWVAAAGPDGSLGEPRLVAGGPAESIFQPEWSPAGDLVFVSDRTGWWNLYRIRAAELPGSGGEGSAEALCPMEAEFGQPQWMFGMTTYAFVADDTILCRFTRDGLWHVGLLEVPTGDLRGWDLGGTAYGSVAGQTRGHAALIAASPSDAGSVLLLDTAERTAEVLRRASEDEPDPAWLVRPEPVEYPTGDGLTAHALFYAPTNLEFAAPPDERPPLLVKIHGGPTAMASTALDLELQFWTSRGIAVLDVNYGGSSGYGRPYRERLDGQWGVVDLDDCVNGARHMAREGRVDGDRLIIHGGSAGGYTTLCAVAFRDAFRAGGSWFGIGDLEVFVHDTHKFESRYMDRLVGPFPECADRYRERSPIHHIDRISSPVLLLQGLDDRIVPPNQAQLMFDALRARGVPVAYLAFEGEGHGFRKAENIRRALEAELTFYARMLGFDPADELPPLEIENA